MATYSRVKLDFQDVLTFEGRAYLEKMQWDKTEMLFYLQEERRKRALTSSQVTKELTMDGFIGSFEVVKNQQARVRERVRDREDKKRFRTEFF